MKIAILAGEKSGDSYGALLAQNIRRRSPGAFIFGTGGPAMESTLDFTVEGLPYGKMGFSGVLKNIPMFYRFLGKITAEIDKQKPDLVVLIDNPGFNLRVAKALGCRFTCFYYIPPKIWAHGYERIHAIKKYVNGVIAIFPFEEKIYKKEGVLCKWFGHPAVDLMEFPGQQAAVGKGNGDVPVIALLPGSREEEVSCLLPVFIRIAEKLKERTGARVLLSASDENIKKIEEDILRSHCKDYSIAEGSPHELIKGSSLLLAASGTVNLEASMLGTPMVVFYKTSAVNYLLAKLMVKLDAISPVNLMLGEKVVPEYVQWFPLSCIVEDCMDILQKGELYRKEMESFAKIKDMTGARNVSDRAAQFLIGQTAGAGKRINDKRVS